MSTLPDGTFFDPVCGHKTLKEHLLDIDCHKKELTQMIQLKERPACSVNVPYPIGKQFSQSDATLPPAIFHLSNYTQRLKEMPCSVVYDQYSTFVIDGYVANGKLMKPMYHIAPMRTSIQFFTNTTLTRKDKPNSTLNFSMTQDEYDLMQQIKVPRFFSWLENSDHITPPPNQGLCGSCWAIAASTCMSDVFAIKKKIPNPKLSPTYILSCMKQEQCNGGDPLIALREIEEKGIRSTDCIDDTWMSRLPSVYSNHIDHLNNSIPPCQCQKPTDTYYPEEVRALCIPPDTSTFPEADAQLLHSYLSHLYGSDTKKDLSTVPYQQIQNIIKHHIYLHGPVVAGFHVFKNFIKGDFHETNHIYMEREHYQGVQGIQYDRLEEDWIGSHAVVIIGWGKDVVHDQEVEYWLVRNSWGTQWGENGFFKIAMYGSTPYQNRISQFEYPSIVSTDTGFGITGGVIMLKAGKIQPPLDTVLQKEPYQHVYTHPTPSPMYYLIVMVCVALFLIIISVYHPKWMGYFVLCGFIILFIGYMALR
jgi:hypothetical protein